MAGATFGLSSDGSPARGSQRLRMGRKEHGLEKDYPTESRMSQKMTSTLKLRYDDTRAYISKSVRANAERTERVGNKVVK